MEARPLLPANWKLTGCITHRHLSEATSVENLAGLTARFVIKVNTYIFKWTNEEDSGRCFGVQAIIVYWQAQKGVEGGERSKSKM